MSQMKRWMEEEEARAYYTSDDSVCARCFHDEGIKKFINERLVEKQCSVCNRTSKKLIAAPADQVLAFILAKLHEHYQDAYGNAPFDKKKCEYFVESWDMNELISEEMADAAPFETLEWIEEHLKGDVTYCRRDWQVMSPGEALSAGWEQFSKAIKHETRFMFFKEDKDESGEPFLVRPAEMLEELGEAIRRCGLLNWLDAGTRLFRVRGHKAGHPFRTGAELGPPSVKDARTAGRMNAPGIVVAYASFDGNTALSEATGEYTKWSLAEFELLQKIQVVDLTEIPDVPSIFERGPRESLRFLNQFAEDVSQPFTPDLETHVEYAPTQVVSEYLRHRFRDGNGQAVKGVLYWSAKVGGTNNLALFMGADEVFGVVTEAWRKKEPLLKLVRVVERVRTKKSGGS